MCGNYFNIKAAKNPKISSYDVHIYFSKDSWLNQMMSEAVADALVREFPNEARWAGSVEAGMGPHTAPNTEVQISPESFGKVLTWLQLNSNGLSILVHPHTGDEVRDHTALANWVGTPVPLNLEAITPRNPGIINKPNTGPKPPAL